MKYFIKDSVTFNFRSSTTTRLCSFGVQTVLFALCILEILLTTWVSAADLVSVNSAGTDSGNGDSFLPVISADGRFVAFVSNASDLVATDTNGERDVFVRNLQTGTTTLVSVNSAGTDSGNSGSGVSAISSDGRFVTFNSDASDLVATDTNGTGDVFVRDLRTGTTTLVSVNSAGTDSGNGSSSGPSIDPNPAIFADGRFVAFQSSASDLVATDTNGRGDVFVRDLQTGTTTLVSVNSAGTDSGNGFSSDPVISADGRFVAFQSNASDLVTTNYTRMRNVFVRDLQTGTTTLVSVNSAGTDSGNDTSFLSMISTDGRFVAFFSLASDLVATDTNGRTWDVFVRDLQTGTTTLVSVNSAGTDSGNNSSEFPVISADGRFVAFASIASDLVATDTNGDVEAGFGRDVFLRDLQSGTTTLVSVNSAGTDSANSGSSDHVISGDGRFVAFWSSASDLVATNYTRMRNVFVRDLQSGTTTLVSVNSAGTDSANDPSFGPLVISADGLFVAFNSLASDLVATDTNGAFDVFVSGVPEGRDVSFEPDPSTFTFTPDTAGCQPGAVGKFSFDAILTNISEKTFSNIWVEVNELTNNNLLLTNNGLIGAGGRFEVPKIDGYADGELAPEELVDVPFIVCLQNKDSFRLFVNVLSRIEQ